MALPTLALLWLASVTLTTGLTAEALEHAGGLEPTTFGGGYWLALGVDATVVLWAVVRRMRGRAKPWRPLAWLVGIYALLLWLVVFPELATGLDLPDVAISFVLLGADALVSYLFPIVLLVILVRGANHLWRIGRVSSASAQRIGSVAACLGIGSLTLAAGVAAVDIEPKSLDVVVDELVSSLDVEGVEGERQTYAALSLGLGSGLGSGSGKRATLRGSTAFSECSNALTRKSLEDGPLVEQAFRTLMTRGFGKADAEDIIMDTLLRVCQKHADKALYDVGAYYWRAMLNNSKTFGSRAYRGRTTWDDDFYEHYGEPSPAEQVELRQLHAPLQAALAQLSPSDREVLEMRFVDTLSHAEVAARLGKREAAVRQQTKRALDRLRQAWRREHPPR